MPGIERKIVGKFAQVSESLIQKKGLRGIFAEIRQAVGQRSHDSISWLEGKARPGLLGQLTETLRMWGHKHLSGLPWIGWLYDRAAAETEQAAGKAADGVAEKAASGAGATARTGSPAAGQQAATAVMEVPEDELMALANRLADVLPPEDAEKAIEHLHGRDFSREAVDEMWTLLGGPNGKGKPDGDDWTTILTSLLMGS